MSERKMVLARPGTFKPGKSGNPKGRPKVNASLKEMAKKYTQEAVAVLVEVMQDKKAPPASRITAATAILDRGYGRPVPSAEQREEDLNSIPTCIEICYVTPEEVRREERKKERISKREIP